MIRKSCFFLNPETQGIPVERRGDSYHSDGAHVLKLAYLCSDEIDFICVSHVGADYVVEALRQCGSERCEAALGVIDRALPAAVETINSQLTVRPATRHAVGEAQALSRNLLQRALDPRGAELGR